MDEIELIPNPNQIDKKTEEQISAVCQILQTNDDGVEAVPINSKTLIQYCINDFTNLMQATPDKIPVALQVIENRLINNRHEKMLPLYRIPMEYFIKWVHAQSKLNAPSPIITQLQTTISTSVVGQESRPLVLPEQIEKAMAMLEDANAITKSVEKIEFEFDGIVTYVWNGTRDRIFRYLYLHRERHYSHHYSNKQIAEEMKVELCVTVDYAAKTISHVNRWFVNEITSTWLSGDYIHHTQMYFSYRGYTHLTLNYLHQPPNQQQIVDLGRQLHVSTKEHPEE